VIGVRAWMARLASTLVPLVGRAAVWFMPGRMIQADLACFSAMCAVTGAQAHQCAAISYSWYSTQHIQVAQPACSPALPC
jgi:hypothetical protein